MWARVGISTAILLLLSGTALASVDGPIEDTNLTSKMRSAIIARVVETFELDYADAEIAKAAVVETRRRFENGEYDGLITLGELTDQLTLDLREICNDLHILILPYEELPAYRFEDRLEGSPDDNYGFQSLELLPGNIGYLHLTGFYNTREAGDTAVAAMNFLANCDALIIDLRLNGGGDTTMADMLSSYFFDRSQLLTRYKTRGDVQMEEVWTQNYVPGPSMTDTPVYILLSKISFSAAEGLAYQLKHLGRATIVGEQTLGGGNAVTYRSYPDELINIRIPNSREINPVTGTSFQSIGVTPDIEASFGDALHVANCEAIRELLAEETNEQKRSKLTWALEEYEARLHPVVFEDGEFSDYVGEYGERSIRMNCGRLQYVRSERPARELLPMGRDRFSFVSEKGYSNYRIYFIRDASGAVSGFYFNDDADDPTDVYERTSGTDQR